MEDNKKLKSYIISTLRAASFRIPVRVGYTARKECIARAKLGRGQYECNSCRGVFKQYQLKIDHVLPVVDIKLGFQGWDVFINRLFCNTDNLSAICSTCHDSKSAVERELRKAYKPKKVPKPKKRKKK